MKVLVVGPYPPSLSDIASNTVATVGELLDKGHDVHVVSPERSAAHEHRNMAGIRGVWNIYRYKRNYSTLVVQFDAGIFVRPGTGKIMRTLDCFAFAFLLKSFKHTEIRFVTLASMPKSVGGRAARSLWKSVDHIVVNNEDDRLLLQSAGGCSPDQISVNDGASSETAKRNVSSIEEVVPWEEVAVDVDAVQAQISARANKSREKLTGNR